METSLKVGRWNIRVDPELTADIYGQTSMFACDCTDCANFRAAGERTFSLPFLHLLRQLGIDPLKPAELCHYGNSGEPMPTQGWFHFVGHLDGGRDAWKQTGDNTHILDSEPFLGMKSIGFTSRIEQAPETFSGYSLVQLEFETVVPWVTPVPLA